MVRKWNVFGQDRLNISIDNKHVLLPSHGTRKSTMARRRKKDAVWRGRFVDESHCINLEYSVGLCRGQENLLS